MADPIRQEVLQLGRSTRMDPATGNLWMNMPLIERLAQSGPRVVQPLYQLLQVSMETPQVVEALYLAQRLAEQHVPGVSALYAAAARFNQTRNPLVQIYLAGFYRKLNVPESFGPMLDMFIRNVLQPPAPIPGGISNPQEEIGGTLLELIARKRSEP